MTKAGLTLGALLFAHISLAAEDPSSAYNQAFEREYGYLIAQKEALTRQRRTMQGSIEARRMAAEREVSRMQRELTRLAADNDESHERLSDLEKRKREIQRQSLSLESTYGRATQGLLRFEKGLHFELAKEKAEARFPREIRLGELGPLFHRAAALLASSGGVETFNGVFLDDRGRLTEGQVTRLGRVAAFTQTGGQDRMLGPDGLGQLKVIEGSGDGGAVFIFDDMTVPARLLRPAGLVERLADLGPLLFLGLMFLLVAGLFVALVRI